MINTIIPSQNFEIVRDRIATILANECANQAALMNASLPNSGNYLGSVVVEVERSNPVDKVEIPVINVSVVSADFSNKRQGQVDGTVTYAIDHYVSAKTTATDAGDKIANFRLQKMIGFSRYVLEDPIYRTLNFNPGFIGHSMVTGFQIRAAGKEDATNSAMGRLTYTVRMIEGNTLLTALPVSQSSTTINIDNTTQGYFIDHIIP